MTGALLYLIAAMTALSSVFLAFSWLALDQAVRNARLARQYPIVGHLPVARHVAMGLVYLLMAMALLALVFKVAG